MSKTLEETKVYIMEFAKEHKLNKKSIAPIMENIKTDKNGMVDDMHFYLIDAALHELLELREMTIGNIETANRLRAERLTKLSESYKTKYNKRRNS